jgi:hypothetical protein
MKNSIYKKYCEQKLPHDIQKQAEGFASMSDTVQEEMFRAGFYCGLHINDIFPDPDRPVQDNGYILVRKEDVNLDLYQKVKAEIAKEPK